MGLFQRIGEASRRLFGPMEAGRGVQPARAAYFHGENNPFLFGFNPQLREHFEDVAASWDKSAARSIAAFQNNGFMAGIVEIASGSVVGSGLRMAARPEADILGWTAEETIDFTRVAEARFRSWARSPVACDAGGVMTFGQMQQAAFGSYLGYGEILSLMPMFKRPNVTGLTRLKMLPPTRLSSETDTSNRVIQGVKVDDWGAPVSYRIRRRAAYHADWEFVDIPAADRDGKPNVIHIKDPGLGATRGISPFATIIKTYRQVDQYFDANMTSAMLQTIFAATIKTNIAGSPAFDGLLTPDDGKVGEMSAAQFASMKGEWYDASKIDLSQHGRVAHLYPGDELIFNEAKMPAQQFDHFMGWLLREIARGAGVTYESATGDYRGATYSSVRMAGAVEWLTVMRRRQNIIVPFCEAVYTWWLDEEIATGRIPYKGGYQAFVREREFASRSSWTGPARPQADDFKTARALQVRKEMQAITQAEIAEEYGQDWDDIARQQAKENDFYVSLGLPKPWVPNEPEVDVEDGDVEGDQTPDGSKERPKRSSRRPGDGNDPSERDPAESRADELVAG